MIKAMVVDVVFIIKVRCIHLANTSDWHCNIIENVFAVGGKCLIVKIVARTFLAATF